MNLSDNNETVNFTALCEEAAMLISNVGFQAVLWLIIFESVVATILNSYLIILILRVTVFHANLRWLLVHHSFNLVLFGLAQGGKAVYFLWVWLILEEPCRFVTTMFDCKFQELINIVPLVNSIYSMMVLCLERLYATVLYRTYDGGTSRPWLACFLITVAWLIVVLNQTIPLYKIPRDKWMPICSNLLTISPSTAEIVLGQNMTVEILAVLMAFALSYANYRLLDHATINRATHTLGARFQISQNVAVNRLLLPTAACHAISFMNVYVYLFIIIKGLDLESSIKLILLHVTYVATLLYAIVHASLALLRNPHLRKSCFDLTSILPRFMKNRDINKPAVIDDLGRATLQANLHFQALEQMWNSPEHSREKRK